MADKSSSRRVKQLIITRETLPQLFRDGQLIIEGLPENSRIVSMDRRPEYDDYAFTVQNPAFEKVETGENIPEITIEALDTGLKNTETIGEQNTQKMY